MTTQERRETIIHIDMDSFYVSVERLLDPSLIGKPVVVGGSPDARGVVASASYEARQFGVRSAMPMGRALSLCPQLVIVRGTMSRYVEYSRQIRSILEDFTPLVEMASQDEAYMDLAGTERLWGPPQRTAQRIRERLTGETGLPCSLGLSTSRLVSKIASALCKPRAMLWVPSGSEESFLAPLPIRRMPGIGPRTAEELESRGIKFLGDLVRTGPKALAHILGEHGAELYLRAKGEAFSPIVPHEDPKSISAEETFAQDSTDTDFLHSMLSNLAEKVGSRLRNEGFHAATITLKYRYQGFETHTAARTLPCPTWDDLEILETAKELLWQRRDEARPVRLLGIAASRLGAGSCQPDMLAAEAAGKRESLLTAIDAVRDRHGYAALHRASSGGRHEEKNDHQWG